MCVFLETNITGKEERTCRRKIRIYRVMVNMVNHDTAIAADIRGVVFHICFTAHLMYSLDLLHFLHFMITYHLHIYVIYILFIILKVLFIILTIFFIVLFRYCKHGSLFLLSDYLINIIL